MKLDLLRLEPELRNAVLDIVGLVRDAGGRALMVGGSVCDLVSGVKDVKDVDLEVYGVEPGKLEKIIGSRYEFDSCGVSFGVLKIKHLDIDVSLPRRESKHGEGHRGFVIDAEPNLTIPEAASRRDFTINAMYYDPLAEELIDPYGGLKDFENRILRHVSEKFEEAPPPGVARHAVHRQIRSGTCARNGCDLPRDRHRGVAARTTVRGVGGIAH